MKQKIYVGVDGGGSKSTVRIENVRGDLLAQTKGGPANIRLATEQAWLTINRLIDQALSIANIPRQNADLWVGMGLAGCEIKSAYDLFINFPHDFAHLIVTTDAHTACLGAHAGEDGSIIIAGTGAVGYQIRGNDRLKVGGWGFPHDDDGSGAWMGLAAVKLTLKWIDGRAPSSLLAEKVYAHFGHNVDRLVAWTDQANATSFAQLAPLVIEASKVSDEAALQIIKKCAKHIDLIALKLLSNAELPIALLGGIACYLEPYLNASVKTFLQLPRYSADIGAIELVKE